MMHSLFTVYDSKAAAYLPPFTSQNEGTAVRSIMATLRNSEHPFALNPEDFTLFYLGDFDDQTGLYSVHAPRAVANMLELLSRDAKKGKSVRRKKS